MGFASLILLFTQEDSALRFKSGHKLLTPYVCDIIFSCAKGGKLRDISLEGLICTLQLQTTLSVDIVTILLQLR